MKKKWFIVSIVLALSMLLCITGCGSKESPATSDKPADTSANASNASSSQTNADGQKEKVTLTIIHEHSEEAAQHIPSSAGFRAMLDKFKAEHPWVTLEETIISNAEIGNKYLALIAADDLPDVTYVRYPWLEDMAGNGMLADLTDYVNPDDYVDGLFSVTYNGRVYGLPNKHSVFNLILYNEKMWKEAGFDKFPETIDELIEAGKVFKSMGKTAIAVGNTGKWFAVSYFASPLMYDYCGKEWVESMLAGETKYNWTDESFVNAMAKLQEMTVLFNEDINMKDDIWAAGWYMQGNAAAHAVGSWGVDTCKNMSSDYPEVWNNTRVIILPAANNKTPTLISATGGAGIGVNSKLKGAEFQAALECCLQISSKDYAKFMAERASPTPVKIDLDFSGRGIQYEDLAAILNGSKDVGLNFNDYFKPNLSSVLQEEVQNLFAGTTTPQAVAEKMQLTYDNMIKK